MQVYVIAQEIDGEVFARVCAPRSWSSMQPVFSPLYRVDHYRVEGNPYLIFGKIVEKATGYDKYALSINVAQPSSGAIGTDSETAAAERV